MLESHLRDLYELYDRNDARRSRRCKDTGSARRFRRREYQDHGLLCQCKQGFTINL